MADIRPQLSGVWSALAASSSRPGGRAVMFIASEPGEGTSTIARAFAELAAARAHKPVWLCDLDLVHSPQHTFYANEKRSGPLGPAFDMGFGRTPFWRTAPGTTGDGLMVAHRIGKSNLHVSRFRREKVAPDQAVQVTSAGDYWRAARAAMEIIVVDAPAINRARSGLALCADMDGVVLVVAAESTDASKALALRDEVLSRGGRCLGVVVNRSRDHAGNRRAS